MKKYPFVKQNGLKDCGVCSLKMIIQYYGGDYPLEKLRDLTNTTKDGTSAYDLIGGGKKIGLDASGYHVELKDIKNEMLPAIAHVIINKSYQHFVVIYKIVKDKIIIADPADKLKKIKISEFAHIYQNTVLIYSPITKLQKYKENKVIQNVIRYVLKHNKKYLLCLIILTPLIISTSIILTLQPKIFLDFIMQNKIFLLTNIFIIIICIQILLQKIKNHTFLKLQSQMDIKLYSTLLQKIILLPYQYYRNHTTGEIISKIQELEKISNFISVNLPNLIINILFILFSSIILFFTNKNMFAILIVQTMLLFFISMFYHKKKILSYNNYFHSKSNFYSNLTESITGFETVKGLSLEQYFTNQLQSKYNNLLNSRQNLYKLQLKEKNIQDMMYYIGHTILILIGCSLIQSGKINFSEFLVFFSFYSYFCEPFIGIADFIYQLKEIKFSIKNINDIINYNFETRKNKNNKNNINYCNISTQINESDKLILFGESGSGKSTLLKAIKGYITLDGVTTKFNSNDIVYISQNEFLFTDTIYNNIVLGSNNLTDLDKIIKICKLDEVIKSKKLGVNTLIEENGFNLSGGEKQRIILARSLMRNPKVLLIDEGLSQVNVEMERIILKNIIKNYKEMIIIFVSHRENNSDLFTKKLTLKGEYN